ncbi:uncharacterized protein EKO05_0011167 [Ascochyta rabiei]|uniref:Uncharacterized protein n=1 Tax=Didymella rabiei TaxID=5454 RepID=A0A163A828_DIDRA|nr:uncharacterized protein EKO05_0011167 [Ascochyta rabiei]KZM21040.1 hypothetical protein ST47_g7840 [Ascochyta rabiei]UPX20960.1 hypothetical protein EKO05_0011167 [Ascochyta rabiei]
MDTQQSQPDSLTIQTTTKAQFELTPQETAESAQGLTQGESFTVSSSDDERKQETQRQAWFENAIKKELKIPNSYVQVAPLIIRWDPEIDDYRDGHNKEIEDLNRVFARFGFSSSTELRLNPKVRKPQFALNSAISEHISAHDGQNKLMIIYYTGHGILDSSDGEKRLLLAARRNEDEQQEGNSLAVAYWHKAESPLLDEDIEGDVLTILDCCFASDAQKGRHHSRRIYDLLAACPKGGNTPAPGEFSFTRSLINTLDRLWAADPDQRILTTRLLEEITRNSGGQAKLHDRLYKDDGRHVQLRPIDGQSKEQTQHDAEQFDSSPLEEAGVKLRFSLQAKDITQVKIEAWAQRLVKASQDANIPLRRIDWLRMDNNEPGQRLRNVVEIFRERHSSSSNTHRSTTEPTPTNYPRSISPDEVSEYQGPRSRMVLDDTSKTTLSISQGNMNVQYGNAASTLQQSNLQNESPALNRLYGCVMVPLPWLLCLLMFAASFLLSHIGHFAQRYLVIAHREL